MSLQELAQLAQPFARALCAQKLEKGLYNVYSGDTPDKGLLIRDYADKIEHVRIDSATRGAQMLSCRIK